MLGISAILLLDERAAARSWLQRAAYRENRDPALEAILAYH
ncbi:MAG: hypothetical protein ACRDIB_07920 [Ardenticatenaceae bacterium]